MADFDKIKINGVPYNVKDTATAQAVAQVERDLANTKETVQQQGQQISQQGQQITEETAARQQADTQLGQQISEETRAREQLAVQVSQNTYDISTIRDDISGLDTRNPGPPDNLFRYSLAHYDNTPAGPMYGFPQGSCMTGPTTLVIAMIPVGTGAANNNTVQLRVCDTTTGSFTTTTVANAGHCQNLCYANGRVYATVYSTTEGNSSLVVRFNQNLTAIDQSWTMPFQTTCLVWDNVRNVFMMRLAGSTNTEAYWATFNESFVQQETVTLKEGPFVSTNKTTGKLGRQAAVFYKGLIYQAYSLPSTISAFDPVSGDWQFDIDYPAYINNYYRQGELESIAVWEDTDTFLSVSASRTYKNWRTIVRVCRHAGPCSDYSPGPGLAQGNTNIPVYVSDTDNYHANGSQDAPFESVAEAVDTNPAYTIYIMGDFENGGDFAALGRNMSILKSDTVQFGNALFDSGSFDIRNQSFTGLTLTRCWASISKCSVSVATHLYKASVMNNNSTLSGAVTMDASVMYGTIPSSITKTGQNVTVPAN